MQKSNTYRKMEPMHRPARSQPDFAAALKERGLKVTASRVDVLNALAAGSRPRTIRQIVAALDRSERSKTFTVTVYRVLADLKKAGLVRQVDFQQPHAFYELADPDDHHHLVCLSCGKVEDFTGCEADRLARKALSGSTEFAAVTGHSFELFGTCKACQPA